VGELSEAISALALNANLKPRCSLSTFQDYFIEKLVSSRLMNARHELSTTGIGYGRCPVTPTCQEDQGHCSGFCRGK